MELRHNWNSDQQKNYLHQWIQFPIRKKNIEIYENEQNPHKNMTFSLFSFFSKYFLSFLFLFINQKYTSIYRIFVSRPVFIHLSLSIYQSIYLSIYLFLSHTHTHTHTHTRKHKHMHIHQGIWSPGHYSETIHVQILWHKRKEKTWLDWETSIDKLVSLFNLRELFNVK